MKKDYIVELREEEANELMDDHWVGELVRCKDCRWGEPVKNYYGEDRIICGNDDTYIDRYITVPQDWFCADGERQEGR
jgi:hypothetical protein